MPTLAQALLLGAERLNAPPEAPHPAVEAAWSRLDWSGAKETALLEAIALAGTIRAAGAVVGPPLPAPQTAPAETAPLAPPRAAAALRPLLAEEWRALLPEWLELCAHHHLIVPPFFLRTLFHVIAADRDRTLLRRVAGQRGLWLARQNPAWSWLAAASDSAAAAVSDASSASADLWETGTPDERLAWFQHARRTDSGPARERLEKSWSDETPDFRARVLPLLHPALSLADEPFLTRVLKDRRKDVRAAAQALLAAQPDSAFSGRLRARAETLLVFHRGLLGSRLEVILPAAFDPAWSADAFEEKPPAGTGEKAFWTQQILGAVPLRFWVEKFDRPPAQLIELAAKSKDWADLLLGAWFRAACLHRDAEAAAALLPSLLARTSALAGTHPQAAATALLAVCGEPDRWRLVLAIPDIAWTALPLLTGKASAEETRALLGHLAPAMRDGVNPGGSPTAIVAARRIPPALRETAATLLARDNGLSKPADAFLQALDLRANLHAAFAASAPR